MDSGEDLSEVLPATAAGAPGDSAAEAPAIGTLAQRVEAQRQEVIQRTGQAPRSQGWGLGFEPGVLSQSPLLLQAPLARKRSAHGPEGRMHSLRHILY